MGVGRSEFVVGVSRSLGPYTSSLGSAGTWSASPGAPLRHRLQLESFIQELLLLGLRESRQSILMSEPISGGSGPGAKDGQSDARVIFTDAHRYGRVAAGKEPGRPMQSGPF